MSSMSIKNSTEALGLNLESEEGERSGGNSSQVDEPGRSNWKQTGECNSELETTFLTPEVPEAKSSLDGRQQSPVDDESPSGSPKTTHKPNDLTLTPQGHSRSTTNLDSLYTHRSNNSMLVHSNSREASVEKVIADGTGNFESLSPLAVPPAVCTIDSTNWQDSVSRSSESGKSVDWTAVCKHSDVQSKETVKSDRSSKGSDKKKKTSSWYNVLNPTYKSKSDDFKRLFRDLPESERLIVDYSCALQKDILVHGRLYVSQNYFCFYANIFRWETFLLLRCRDITSMTKEKTARVIPNAIQVCTDSEKHFFTSFGARDKTYMMLFRIWQNALLETPMSSQELWQCVHHSYGEELGLTSDDDDYVAPFSQDDEHKNDGIVAEQLLDMPKENGYMSEKYETASATTQELEEPPTEVTTESVAGPESICKPVSAPEVRQLESLGPVGKLRSAQFPTDFSDTSESGIDDAGEVSCLCSNHDGKEMMNCVISLPVDHVFNLVFSGSKFFHDLLASRKTYNIMESSWQLCPENGHKMRQVTYTLTLNHSMAKTAQTTETQRLLKHSKPGQLYVIVCDVVNTGIPYSDTFSVKSHYCLTRITNNQCRLCVHGNIYYKKSVWGLVKSLIEKSAIQGLHDFCVDLEVALNKEADLVNQQSTKKLRRRKRVKPVEFSKGDSHKELSRSLHTQTSVRRLTSSYLTGIETETLTSSDLITKVILATLLILLLLNILLFYKLWSLEDETLRVTPTSHQLFDVPLESLEKLSRDEWIKLLKKQEILHRIESERWRDVIEDVLKVIKIVETSLTDLKGYTELHSSAPLLNLAGFAQIKSSTHRSEEEITRPKEDEVLVLCDSDQKNSVLCSSDKDTSMSYQTPATVPSSVFKEHETKEVE
ncbi:protein Aster-B-like isoform X1 [Tachypleus tridentatus]|uniref:protein Aster-B-like isoform X1 n=1 Tax=Tachypleus tridentatus TaxID=6853 RepID=UPI003FD5EDF9